MKNLGAKSENWLTRPEAKGGCHNSPKPATGGGAGGEQRGRDLVK